MTPTRSIARFAAIAIALTIQCMALVLGIYLLSFTAFYLAHLAPQLLHLQSIQEAEHLIDTVCRYHPEYLNEGIRQGMNDRGAL